MTVVFKSSNVIQLLLYEFCSIRIALKLACLVFRYCRFLACCNKIH